VAAPGLRQPATVRWLLGEIGDEEETQGNGTRERQEAEAFFRKNDNLTRVWGFYNRG